MSETPTERYSVGVFGAPARVLRSFLPSSAPLMARRSYRLELTATFFFAIALAAIDSGVLAVFAKQTFTGVEGVSETKLNFAVAVLGTMDALANILSFVWSSLGHARRKIPIINALQVAVIVSIAVIAMLPRTSVGLSLLVLLALTARSCWSGIITIRPTIWRRNYPRDARASIVGRLSTIQLLVVATGGATLGLLLDVERGWYAPAVLGACAVAVLAVGSTGRLRVRRQGQLLRQEQAGAKIMKPWHGPLVVLQVLRRDRRYAQFMLCMFVLGFGNLMVNPILAITLREQFGLNYLGSILITSTLQQGVQVLAIPMWARMLDRAHIVRFRAVHAWCFAVSGVVLVLGAAMNRVEFMFAAAAILGFAYAGGALAWHLGHVDFSPPSETSQYMATHVTLNGVRGLAAPLVAVALYEGLKTAGVEPSSWVFGASLAVSVSGAAGFVALLVSMERESGALRKSR